MPLQETAAGLAARPLNVEDEEVAHVRLSPMAGLCLASSSPQPVSRAARGSLPCASMVLSRVWSLGAPSSSPPHPTALVGSQTCTFCSLHIPQPAMPGHTAAGPLHKVAPQAPPPSKQPIPLSPAAHLRLPLCRRRCPLPWCLATTSGARLPACCSAPLRRWWSSRRALSGELLSCGGLCVSRHTTGRRTLCGC